MGDPASWWLDVRLTIILRTKYILKYSPALGVNSGQLKCAAV